MRCEHEHDDGAYVLGALSPAERAAYERHLATCSFCREAVADIAVLPGLLGRLDPAEFAKLLDPTLTSPAPERNRMPDLVTAAQTTRRQERKKLRVRVLSTALAAAVVALIVGIGAVFWMGGPGSPKITPPGPTVAMSSIEDDTPITAELNLAAGPGGTKVNLVCTYTRSAEYKQPYTIRLMAYGPDNEAEQVGSWVASPGTEFTMSGVTHFAAGALSRLELVRNDGKALLAYDVP
jgi:predicted anti-sigma-YlaC factor YlaD